MVDFQQPTECMPHHIPINFSQLRTLIKHMMPKRLAKCLSAQITVFRRHLQVLVGVEQLIKYPNVLGKAFIQPTRPL